MWWWWHSSAPCRDFSIARHTIIHTHECPWGFKPNDAERKEPNFMLAVVGLLTMAMVRTKLGSLVHEHPASAHAWAIPFWHWFAQLADAEIGRYCSCLFGAP